jgi:hypothetical protein
MHACIRVQINQAASMLLTNNPFSLHRIALHLVMETEQIGWIISSVCRYGNIFKTSIVGRSVVVSADPDLNYYVFQQEGKLFESWYPDTFTEIFGRDNVGSLHGFLYKYLKTLVLRLYGQENLRAVLLAETHRACRASLASWATRPSVELKDAISTVRPASDHQPAL